MPPHESPSKEDRASPDPCARPPGPSAPDTPTTLPLLTVEDLAGYFSLSPRAAREILQRGELPGFRIGRRWYLRLVDLDAALAEKVADGRRNRDAAVRILRGLPVARRAKECP